MAQNVMFLCGTLDKVNAKAVDNGQLLFATDSKQLFIDNGGSRIEIAEIIHVAEPFNATDAITNKFYYIDSLNALVISDGTKWKQVNAQSTIETGETAGTIKVNGTEVAVAGLGTAAYKAVGDFEKAGEAAKVLGTEADVAGTTTVYGVKADVTALKTEVDGKVTSVDPFDKSISTFRTIDGSSNGDETLNPDVKVRVNISTTANNYLTLDENGLYVPTPAAAAKYTIKREGVDATSNNAVATCRLYEGEVAVGDKIDIPKDYLVKNATMNTCTVDGTPAGFTAGQKYIDFIINSTDGAGNESHIYLNVSDLVDAYDAGDGITINNENAISVNVKVENGLSITDNKIALTLATADTIGESGTIAGTAGAMSSADKTKLDGIATGAEVNVIKSVDGALAVSDTGVLSVATADATKDGIISKETFTKINGVETGAQANKIETISFNGTDIAITDKKAAINFTWVEL